MELKVRAAREVAEGGARLRDVARVFGLPDTTVSEWVRRYRMGGVEALLPQPRPAAKPKAADPRREAVAGLKREHPEYGTRRSGTRCRASRAGRRPE